MKLTRFRRRMTAWWLASALFGCGSPVVDPGRPTTLITPPILTPPPGNSSGLPVLETPEVQQVPAESVLNLPSDSNSATYHSVKAGETLSSIAKRYGISAEKLRTANGLDASATLKSQQLIYVPQDR
ncbi:MAG: LysM peptidoglycan-binding domain-containing protein [Planctomycetaceae bacterium]|nr:LysM peptidoglycan-binding domain-containing protein [Planctomycetaceae bacterium]